jgi:hypothetical protein
MLFILLKICVRLILATNSHLTLYFPSLFLASLVIPPRNFHVYASSRVPKPRYIIRQLPLQRLLFLRQLPRRHLLRYLVSPLILPRTPSRHEQRQAECHTASH